MVKEEVRFPGYHGVRTFHPDHWSKNGVRVEHPCAKVAVRGFDDRCAGFRGLEFYRT